MFLKKLEDLGSGTAIFNFDSSKIRAIQIKGEPYFVAKD